MHTRCALVTGVQTCALPICEQPSTQRENVRPDRSAWRALEKQPNVRAAMALAEIDEDVYAGEALRHQAQIGDPRQHEQLIGMAEALSLPENQLWLAHNTPQGRKLAPATRYPQQIGRASSRERVCP